MAGQSLNRLGHLGLIGGGAAAIGLAVFAVSCGGGGGSDTATPSATQTSIDSTSAASAATEAAAFIPLCSAAVSGSSAGGGSVLVTRALALMARQHQARLAPARVRAMAFTSTQPADTLGDCGGRFGYEGYTHTSGITNATLVFTDYCTTNTDTGYQEVLNGRLPFVNTATPTSSGPITTKFEGSSSDGITTVVRSGSTTISSQTVKFTGLVYNVGVPGGTPTASNPDTVSIADITQVNNTSSTSFRQTNYALSTYDTTSGGTQVSFSGRGYRANGEYYDISTSTPVVVDASSNYVSGAFTFAGSGGTSAVVTLVPGSTLQATLTVNGVTDTSFPACTP